MIAGVLLAAGAGRRMGTPKALVRYRGRLLVERARDTLAGGGCAPLIVVVGAGADDVRATAELPGVTLVDNADWPTGMASSVRAGLAAVPVGVQAVVLSLVDLPGVGPEAVRRVVAGWRSAAAMPGLPATPGAPGGPAVPAMAAVATYGGEPGHPVLLAAPVLAEVAAAVSGDRGAGGWLRHPVRRDRVLSVPCDGAGDPRDLDVPDDLAVAAAWEE